MNCSGDRSDAGSHRHEELARQLQQSRGSVQHPAAPGQLPACVLQQRDHEQSDRVRDPGSVTGPGSWLRACF